MPPELPYPWLWLGFDDIYFKESADADWRVLDEYADLPDEAVPWSFKVGVAGGEKRLYLCGQRLGLGDVGLDELQGRILKALLKKVGDRPVVFAPPVQLVGLARVMRQLEFRPRALICDSMLFAGQGAEQADTVDPEDAYIPDWLVPRQRIVRRFPTARELRGGPLKPVLLTVQAYVNNQPLVLAYYLDDQEGITPATRTLKAPRQLQQGQQPVGVGLVWAWGFGPRLWQWALMPRLLPAFDATLAAREEATWQLELVAHWIYRISSKAGNDEVRLRQPLIYETFS